MEGVKVEVGGSVGEGGRGRERRGGGGEEERRRKEREGRGWGGFTTCPSHLLFFFHLLSTLKHIQVLCEGLPSDSNKDPIPSEAAVITSHTFAVK